MSDPIRGKVAKILNSRELALNVGSNSGVRVGMLFDVLDPKGYDIRDPETMQILGSVERPKVRVKVTQVLEQLSIASTFRATKVNIGGNFDLGATGRIADLLRPPQYVTTYETLKTDEKTWEDLDEADSYVKTGDPVVSVRALPTEVVDVA